MKASDIEAWALRLIDLAKAGKEIEDSRIELKRQWPNPQTAARQVAGHANAAHGESILWLIGVDEKQGPIDCKSVDFAAWHSQFRACFDGIHPDVQDINLLADSKLVTALVFDTTRSPFVVKNPKFGNSEAGPVQYEVPWREARSIRTARREDLVRMLTPQAKAPIVEPMSGGLRLTGDVRQAGTAANHYVWEIELQLYVVPQGTESLVLPNHKCVAWANISDSKKITFDQCSLNAIQRMETLPGNGIGIRIPGWRNVDDSVHVSSSSTEVVLSGAGAIVFNARLVESTKPFDPPQTVSIGGISYPANSDVPARFEVQLQRQKAKDGEPPFGEWSYIAPPLLA